MGRLYKLCQNSEYEDLFIHIAKLFLEGEFRLLAKEDSKHKSDDSDVRRADADKKFDYLRQRMLGYCVSRTRSRIVAKSVRDFIAEHGERINESRIVQLVDVFSRKEDDTDETIPMLLVDFLDHENLSLREKVLSVLKKTQTEKSRRSVAEKTFKFIRF